MFFCALGCVVPLWLAATMTAHASLPDPIPSVRFRYEEESRLTGSPIFPDPKIDYQWGEFEKHNSDARLFRHVLYRSDPSDRLVYSASIRESFVLDPSTVLTCLKSIEIRLDHSPRSLEDAKAIHERCFSAGKSSVNTRYYFETSSQPAHEKLLSGYSFLGMTPDGPIWRLSEPTSDSVRDKLAFEYKSQAGIEYRLVFDRQRSIFSDCSISLSLEDAKAPPEGLSARDTSSGQQKQHTHREPFSYVSSISEKGDDFILTSSSTQNPSSPNPQVTRVTRRIFDFQLDRTDPIAMVYAPKNGDSIAKVGTGQIKFEWQDGKIAKVISPYVAEDVDFVKSRRWILAVNLAIAAALLAAYWVRRKRLGKALLIAISLSTSYPACASDAYCGVYSLYGAAKSLGKDVDLEELIDSQYISSNLGSTPQDLVKASQAVGLEATTLWGLGIDSLRSAEQPLILHAAPMGVHATYQHWILFLGFGHDGYARVVDGAGGVARCTVEEVLARWDGIAIAIREPSLTRTRYLSTELAGLCFLITYGGVFSLVVKSGLLTRWRRSDVSIHIVALLAVSTCAGHASQGRGFRDAAASIDSALGLTHHPKVTTVDELLSKMKRGAILIDCRYERDYKLGHVDGAISVPIDVGLGDFARILSDIDREGEIVVYCQSPQCGFSEYSATMLAGAGFRNITVFEGGFEAWKKHLGGK